MSEFGSGLVVCLVKFSEHLMDERVENIYAAISWKNSDEIQKQKWRNEAAQHPQGDTARRFGLLWLLAIDRSDADWLKHCIEIWANGASDHFYDLHESAGTSLKQLASLTLSMGHGFTGQMWDEEDWNNVLALWKEATLELDERLGVDHDWGEW